MKVPLSWLRQYVDVEIPLQELAHRLTMAGVEVGDVIETGGWSGCFVGQVMDIRPHPQADRLRLCRVSTGAEELEVVCGAPNVATGQKICFATVGARLLNAHSGKHETLKAANIRGVESHGMICSELELGMGEDHSGIVVLPANAPLGMPLDDYLGDTVLDLELTPNRLDCLSILGVAHEVAALTQATVREPEVDYPEEGPPIDSVVSISVADPDLCPRYTASLIQGITIGPSPQWLQDRLAGAGLRPINNVVDVTNFVMLEMNQPLHSFDFDKIRDGTVVVRRAKAGETLVTLDNVKRDLTSNVLVIADTRDPIGMAGVIGGANSEIGPETTSVLLEAATFEAYNNRDTAQSFGLRTEATLRFEKGLRQELAPLGLRRATQLIHLVAGGKVAQGIIDVNPQPAPAPKVSLSARGLKKVLGMDVDLARAEQVLESLGFGVARLDGDGDQGEALDVTVPFWRNDIAIEEDLVEEVVRIVGYDAVPTTMLSTPIPNRRLSPMTSLVARVKDGLAGAGMQEVINYPLVSQADLDKVGYVEGGKPALRVANPMSADHEILRPTLRFSVLSSLAANEGHGEGPFRLFELGREFIPRDEDLPLERETVVAVLAGRRWDHSWLVDDEPLDFYDAKGVLASVLGRLGVEPEYRPAEDGLFQPGRCAQILANGLDLGIVGEVHPSIRQRFDLNAATVTILELRLDSLLESLGQEERKFKSISRFPAATRDMALVVPHDVPAGKVRDIIARHRMVQRVDLFDIYSGENVAPGTKSLAFRVDFQSQERTLTAEEVNRSLDGLLRSLERETGAVLRA
jgi:phenylalanyl-tRNA synthetase beta chain